MREERIETRAKYYPRSSEGCLRHAKCNVRVAGDDSAAVVDFLVMSVAVVFVAAGFGVRVSARLGGGLLRQAVAAVAAGEAAAEVFGDYVHVRQVPSLFNRQVQVAVQEYHSL